MVSDASSKLRLASGINFSFSFTYISFFFCFRNWNWNETHFDSKIKQGIRVLYSVHCRVFFAATFIEWERYWTAIRHSFYFWLYCWYWLIFLFCILYILIVICSRLKRLNWHSSFLLFFSFNFLQTKALNEMWLVCQNSFNYGNRSIWIRPLIGTAMICPTMASIGKGCLPSFIWWSVANQYSIVTLLMGTMVDSWIASLKKASNEWQFNLLSLNKHHSRIVFYL